MRYLKKHQVPFLGFAWNHPLRARWRELDDYDPVVSAHPWLYILKDSWWEPFIPVVMLAVPSIVLARVLPSGQPTGVLILWGGLCGLFMLAFILILLGYREVVKACSRKFIAAMNELAGVLRLKPEHLLTCSLDELCGWARLSLRANAEEHLLKERKFEPGHPERARTQEIFRRHFELLKKFRLISANETWKPFFEQARRDLKIQ